MPVRQDGVAELRQALLLAAKRPLKGNSLTLELRIQQGLGGSTDLKLAAEWPLLGLLMHSPPVPSSHHGWLAAAHNRLPGVQACDAGGQGQGPEGVGFGAWDECVPRGSPHRRGGGGK
jgi:hypothetical protein